VINLYTMVSLGQAPTGPYTVTTFKTSYIAFDVASGYIA